MVKKHLTRQLPDGRVAKRVFLPVNPRQVIDEMKQQEAELSRVKSSTIEIQLAEEFKKQTENCVALVIKDTEITGQRALIAKRCLTNLIIENGVIMMGKSYARKNLNKQKIGKKRN